MPRKVKGLAVGVFVGIIVLLSCLLEGINMILYEGDFGVAVLVTIKELATPILLVGAFALPYLIFFRKSRKRGED